MCIRDRGVLEEWVNFTKPRQSRGIQIADEPGTHLVAARSSAEIAAAEALYFGTICDAQKRLEEGDNLSDFDLSTARRNVGFSAKLALNAGTRLFKAAGGRALSRGNALERQYRNLVASASHHAMVWERNAMAYGQDLFNLKASDDQI